MKKIASLLLVLVVLLLAAACAKPADRKPAESSPEEDNGFYVYVSIADENGVLALAQEKIAVNDADENGVYTVGETLVSAHEARCPAGKDGFAAVETDYGLSITKLWDSHDKTAFLYCVNGQMAAGLSDPVTSGDYVDAFVFTDVTAFSDAYSRFDRRTVDAAPGEKVTLTLSKLGFDESFAPVFTGVGAGVKITVNGKDSDFVTGEDGSVTLSFDKAGSYLLSADASGVEGLIISAPCCVVTVK